MRAGRKKGFVSTNLDPPYCLLSRTAPAFFTVTSLSSTAGSNLLWSIEGWNASTLIVETKERFEPAASLDCSVWLSSGLRPRSGVPSSFLASSVAPLNWNCLAASIELSCVSR